LRPHTRTSFHHQPEAQHPKSSTIHKSPADYPIFCAACGGKRTSISVVDFKWVTTPPASPGSLADSGVGEVGSRAEFYRPISANDGSPVFHPSNFSPGFARAQFTLRPQVADDMECKTDKIRAAWAVGDRIGALRIAAGFFDRSTDTKKFKRGIGAHNNPDFYRQLGKDPEQIVRDALDVLAKRFNLH
jgi:hypothetical protein